MSSSLHLENFTHSTYIVVDAPLARMSRTSQEGGSERVRVCVRARPTANFPHDCLKIDTKGARVGVHMPKDHSHYVNNQQEDWAFGFDNVLENASQDDVYQACARDVVDDVLKGYNGTIMAYGQTGAGKTYTMTGGTSSYKLRGLIPRAIGHVFQRVAQDQNSHYRVHVSYLEIYNETFFDLLDASGEPLSDTAVREDERGMVLVKGLRKSQVHTEEGALNCLFEGETNRAVSDHAMNRHSSRSHCIFTMYIERRSRVESTEQVQYSKLHLVDLAGSERVGKTGSTGTILEEAKYINRSLSFLEQVVIALGDLGRRTGHQHTRHIPYRQSKLTNYLRDSLGGVAKTRLIANIWSEREHLEETVSTLKFATRMLRVTSTPTVNIQIDPAEYVVVLQRKIKELKQELTMRDALSNRTDNKESAINYDDYSADERRRVYVDVQAYLDGSTNELPFQSVRHALETFRQFRRAYRNAQATHEQQITELERAVAEAGQGAGGLVKLPPAAVSGGLGAAAPSSPSAVDDTPGAGGEVAGFGGETKTAEARGGGLFVESSGFSVGVVHAGDRPVDESVNLSPMRKAAPIQVASPVANVSSLTPVVPQDERKTGAEPASLKVLPVSDGSGEAGSAQQFASHDQALEHFKTNVSEGVELQAESQRITGEVGRLKAAFKRCSVQVNACKRKIDALTAQIHEMEQVRLAEAKSPEDANVITEEEFEVIQACRQQKQLYKHHFKVRQDIHQQRSYLKQQLKQHNLKMLHHFLEWHKANPSAVGAGVAGKKNGVGVEVAGDSAEVFDNAERFDQLELQRVVQENPEAVSFYNARKHMDSVLKRGGGRRKGGVRKSSAAIRAQGMKF